MSGRESPGYLLRSRIAAGDFSWLHPGSARERALATYARGSSGEGAVLLEASDPAAWIGEWCAAVRSGRTVVCLPAGERLESGSVDLGAVPAGSILLPTGGSTGRPRLAIHSCGTLEAAALGLSERLGGVISSRCVLPLHHVGGLMQVVRAIVSGGWLVLHPWKELEAGRLPLDPEAGGCLSLVPTQLARLLESPGSVSWLCSLRAIFIGGAALDPGLAVRARHLGLRLAPAYGATETAAQATLLEPEEFLAGREGVGTPLPHIRVRIGEGGAILCSGPSVFAGYVGEPSRNPGAEWASGDLGTWDEGGGLRVLGRADDRINTGGEKVVPGLVEAEILRLGLARESLVVGVPDPEWGEVVAAWVVLPVVGLEEARRRLSVPLPRHALPRRWLVCDELPKTPLGKPDRKRARQLALGLASEPFDPGAEHRRQGTALP